MSTNTLLTTSQNGGTAPVAVKEKKGFGDILKKRKSFVFGKRDSSAQMVRPVSTAIGYSPFTSPPKVFGQTIPSLATEPPAIVSQTIKWLKANGMKCEGLFRISAPSTQVENLKNEIETIMDEDIQFPEDESPHVIAGILKTYLRELPEPLLTFDLYDWFIAINELNETQARNEYIKRLTFMLPKGWFLTLSCLMEYLHELQKESSSTKMSASNLGVVFAPVLLRARVDDLQRIIQHSPTVNLIAEHMILYYPEIFSLKEGDIDTVGSKPTTDLHETLTEAKKSESRENSGKNFDLSTRRSEETKKGDESKPAAEESRNLKGSRISRRKEDDKKESPTDGRKDPRMLLSNADLQKMMKGKSMPLITVPKKALPTTDEQPRSPRVSHAKPASEQLQDEPSSSRAKLMSSHGPISQSMSPTRLTLSLNAELASSPASPLSARDRSSRDHETGPTKKSGSKSDVAGSIRDSQRESSSRDNRSELTSSRDGRDRESRRDRDRDRDRGRESPARDHQRESHGDARKKTPISSLPPTPTLHPTLGDKAGKKGSLKNGDDALESLVSKIVALTMKLTLDLQETNSTDDVLSLSKLIVNCNKILSGNIKELSHTVFIFKPPATTFTPSPTLAAKVKSLRQVALGTFDEFRVRLDAKKNDTSIPRDDLVKLLRNVVKVLESYQGPPDQPNP